jgi:N6-L-threonylcarbamoyladenine synthase
MSKKVYILAIESSCDDTSAAVLCNEVVLSNLVAGQDVHREYGGVVPELASRAHQQQIVPVVDRALKEAGISMNQLDAIAFTRGPGLMGSLLVGVSFAKSLSLALDIPLIEVNHMRAHILAHFIGGTDVPKPSFPMICLTVSGGHTQIVQLNDHHSFQQLGKTLDDAAGEAFDKTAKTLGLTYPGGPLIDRAARQGDHSKFKFTKPRIDGLDFSFSGLKTAVLYLVRDGLAENPNFIEENLNDIAASVQYTIVEILMDKMDKAIDDRRPSSIALAGGVSANSGLRTAFDKLAKRKNVDGYIPPFEYCTDNAAMIGIAAYYKYLNKEFTDLSVTATARLSVEK